MIKICKTEQYTVKLNLKTDSGLHELGCTECAAIGLTPNLTAHDHNILMDLIHEVESFMDSICTPIYIGSKSFKK